jgi:hypothetical protein
VVTHDPGIGSLTERIRRLKTQAAAHEGQNAADVRFLREVDALISLFYDDISRVVQIDLKSLFDLFLLKSLYVGRRSTSIATLDYLSNMMTRFLRTRDVTPMPNLLSFYNDLLPRLMEENLHQGRPQNYFEAYRTLADGSLFMTGVFPESMRRRYGRRASGPSFDRAYYVRMGKDYYALAARHELAEATGLAATLARLALYFEVYMEALNTVSETYITGFDTRVIMDKMLDSFNRYRETRDESHLENARKYAALLHLDRRAFPRLWRQR